MVTINGARQSGKSTLAQVVAATHDPVRALTLDDPVALRAAQDDPVGFIEHDGLLVVDEVQRAPGLFLPIKADVDADPRPGRFLLTGSIGAFRPVGESIGSNYFDIGSDTELMSCATVPCASTGQISG